MQSIKTVFWRREFPPIDSEIIAEHAVEAVSRRVAGTLAHRNDLWDECYQDLMKNAEIRLAEEVTRLGGQFAHVHGESIGAKHDDAAGEAWLHGSFTYILYRPPVMSCQLKTP